MCWQPLALQDEAAAQLLAGEEDHSAPLRPGSAPATFHSFLHQTPTQVRAPPPAVRKSPSGWACCTVALA
jgi:hypothetical protein